MSRSAVINTPDPAAVTALGAVQQAEQAFERGEFAIAQEAAERAVALARADGDRHTMGWGLMVLGRTESSAGRVAQAYAAASEAYEVLGVCGDIPRRLFALNTCAVSHEYGGDSARSIELLRQGLTIAQGPDNSIPRGKLLTNVALLLGYRAEYAEAIQCLSEAVTLTKQLPGPRDEWHSAAIRLAFVMLNHARHLSAQGRPEEADAQLDAASNALPPIDLTAWRSFSVAMLYALPVLVEVLAGIGRWPMARLTAAVTLRFARRPGNGPLALGEGLWAVATLYRLGGRPERAIHYEMLVLKARRAHGDQPSIRESLKTLSDLYAQTGDYRRALAYRKELKGQQSQQRQEADALRCRLAAIERQSDRRRYEANEALVHAQRLAVIGRLIAQTHHALSAPIERACSLSAMALALSNQAAPHTSPASVLEELSQTIDRAASLVNQLKLFSYRSTPQPMALSLRDALIGAWQSLEPHVSTRVAQIEVVDDAQLQVWGDAQRLGILLKVMLIELARGAGSDAAPVAVRARIEPGEQTTLVLLIEAGSARVHAASTQGPVSIGAMLCIEIASEMGGSLRAGRDPDGVLRYRLGLPDARFQAQEFPSITEFR